MRKFLVPAAVVAAMAVGSTAFAANAPATPAKAATSTAGKAADCMKQWKAQKTHTQTRKAFLAACEKA